MCWKSFWTRIIPFVVAFSLGLITATILQNENTVPKAQNTVKPVNKSIWLEQGTGFSGYARRGSSGHSNDKKTLSAYYIPKFSEDYSSEIKLKIISKPKPNYTELAKQNNVQGIIRLRVTFLANGQIGSVSPIKELPYGLTEQAVEAAKKIEFKPVIRNGQAESVVKQVEYNFTIY